MSSPSEHTLGTDVDIKSEPNSVSTGEEFSDTDDPISWFEMRSACETLHNDCTQIVVNWGKHVVVLDGEDPVASYRCAEQRYEERSQVSGGRVREITDVAYEHFKSERLGGRRLPDTENKAKERYEQYQFKHWTHVPFSIRLASSIVAVGNREPTLEDRDQVDQALKTAESAKDQSRAVQSHLVILRHQKDFFDMMRNAHRSTSSDPDFHVQRGQAERDTETVHTMLTDLSPPQWSDVQSACRDWCLKFVSAITRDSINEPPERVLQRWTNCHQILEGTKTGIVSVDDKNAYDSCMKSVANDRDVSEAFSEAKQLYDAYETDMILPEFNIDTAFWSAELDIKPRRDNFGEMEEFTADIDQRIGLKQDELRETVMSLYKAVSSFVQPAASNSADEDPIAKMQAKAVELESEIAELKYLKDTRVSFWNASYQRAERMAKKETAWQEGKGNGKGVA